jgi:predicted nucleic acid-binding protein
LGGPPRAVLTAAREQRVALFTSAPLIVELENVMRRDKLVHRFKAIGQTPSDLLDR